MTHPYLLKGANSDYQVLLSQPHTSSSCHKEILSFILLTSFMISESVKKTVEKEQWQIFFLALSWRLPRPLYLTLT